MVSNKHYVESVTFGGGDHRLEWKLAWEGMDTIRLGRVGHAGQRADEGDGDGVGGDIYGLDGMVEGRRRVE